METEEYGQLTFEIEKRNPERYHGLEGRNITFSGYYNPNPPTVLRGPNIVEINGKEDRDTSYSVETRILQGTIYDVTRPQGLDRLDTVNLILKDETYFTTVQCLFLTEEERGQISGSVDSAQHFPARRQNLDPGTGNPKGRVARDSCGAQLNQ